VDHLTIDECTTVGSFLGERVSCVDDPDEDGATGCDDLCPFDADKTDPGVCGCGWGDPVGGRGADRCAWVAVAADPPNCAVDATCPYLRGSDPRMRVGLSAFDLTFDPLVDVADLGPDDFGLRYGTSYFPHPGTIQSVQRVDAATLHIELDAPIPMFRWTCVVFAEGDFDDPLTCIGQTPGDVDGNGFLTLTDVLQLIDGLNGVSELGRWQCDVDASGACTAADILAVIDAINVAPYCFPYYDPPTLRECPTAHRQH